MKVLQPFIPSKEDNENAVPDMFVWEYYPDYPRETFHNQVVMLNAKSKNKKQFWWDYLKFNQMHLLYLLIIKIGHLQLHNLLLLWGLYLDVK
jgi:hypothetical protein